MPTLQKEDDNVAFAIIICVSNPSLNIWTEFSVIISLSNVAVPDELMLMVVPAVPKSEIELSPSVVEDAHFAIWFVVPLPAVEPEEVMVIESVVSSVVMVILLPATNVSVSVALSATTSFCPLTAIVLKASEALLLNVFQSVEDRYPSDEAPDCVMLIVPVVVMVPPCMGAVVAMEVTVPVPPVAAMVKVG